MSSNSKSGSWRLPALVLITAICLIAVLLAGCSLEERPQQAGKTGLSIKSTTFQEGGKIPDKYTCQGQDVSLPLTWSEPPEGTKSFVLIMDDPDAPRGLFTHWLIYNIPPETSNLAEAVPNDDQLQNGALQGENDSGNIGYSGPCPSPGNAHRYQFTLYALDRVLDIPSGVKRKELDSAMKSHILTQTRLTGRYSR
jgi:Raf kinase inhibitor-like YbhB/YbcL family protein